MNQTEATEIHPAQGRPMLWWVGKQPLTRIPAFPAQHVETFDPAGALAAPAEGWNDWPARYPQGGLLFHGDNKEVLGHLLASGFRGQVKLIYIDPPFDSGADYVRRVQLRGAVTTRIEGEGYSLGEQIQYTDIWANDNYLQFMYERLMLLKELLAEDGSIYVHIDSRRSHLIRLLLDEVFGMDNFRNEIIWQRTTAHSDTKGRFGEIHDAILCYVKGSAPVWNELFVPYSEEYIASKYYQIEPETERRFQLDNLTAPGPRPNLEYEWRGVYPPPGRCWAVVRERMQEYEQQGRIVYTQNGMPRYKRYLDEMPGVAVQDIWVDIPPVNPMAAEKEGYPTQKPEALLERIISASSNPGDLILDCFIGSGTTAAVAQKLGRRWIGCDINKGSIQTTSKRLHGIIREQLAKAQAAAEAAAQQELVLHDGGTPDPSSPTVESAPPTPAQYGFTSWRVNDYDLQIQHNEAVHLACEHLGVERTRGDSFFDGVLGKRLVKIIPFGHPLNPLDLEEIKRELEARPEEDRDIAVVCLGKELAADAWLEEWNRHRRAAGGARPGTPNRIEAIELRSDPRYGGIFRHEPATARVRVERRDGKLVVEVDDFISPTIITRLELDATLFRARVPDWRALVDCIMVDPSYDGEVFNVALADIPERKADLVAGRYELPAPASPARVAIKLVDMLGEEVLVVADA